jgi:hypothetical protein
MSDEMVYRVPCFDSAGRAREVRVRLADPLAVAVEVPPPGHAVIELVNIDRAVAALTSMRDLGRAEERRRGR